MKTIIHLHRPKTKKTYEFTSTRKAYKFLHSFRRYRYNNQHLTFSDELKIISNNIKARQQLLDSIQQ
jgi:hypothetical protein